MKIIETYIVQWPDGGGMVDPYIEFGKVHKTSDENYYLERWNGKIRPLDKNTMLDSVILSNISK